MELQTKDADIEEFYNLLETTIQTTLNRGLMVEDFNDKVGGTKHDKHIMDNRIEMRNERGE